MTRNRSDLSGTDLGEEGQVIEFSINMAKCEINLTDTEVDDFFAHMRPYLDAATKTSGGGRYPD